MFDTKFTTEAEALAEITAGKPPACAAALTQRFHDALDETGITDLNLAAEKAVVLHAHFDHEAGLDVPKKFPFFLDAEAETHIIGELMALNHDGRAEERVDLTIPLYRQYREWGVNIYFAGTVAVSQAKLKWDKLNPPPDLDEDHFFKLLNEIPDDNLISLIKNVYTVERKDGKSVRDSAISAIQAGRFAEQLTTLFRGGKNGSDLNRLISG